MRYDTNDQIKVALELRSTMPDHIVADESAIRVKGWTQNQETGKYTINEVNASNENYDTDQQTFNRYVAQELTVLGTAENGLTQEDREALAALSNVNNYVKKSGDPQEVESEITFKDGIYITDNVDTAAISMDEKFDIYTAGLGLNVDEGVYAAKFVKDGGTNTEVLLADGTTKALSEIGGNGGGYNKPAGGIPASDMAAEVQESLTKANTAVQPDGNKGLSTNDFTNAYKNKLDGTGDSALITKSEMTAAISNAQLSGGNIEDSLGSLAFVDGIDYSQLTGNLERDINNALGEGGTIKAMQTDVNALKSTVAEKQDKITSANKLSASLISGLTDNNTTYKFTIGSTTKGDATNGVDLGTLKSESAVDNGTTLSLVTTGEKATWNAKSDFDGTWASLSGKPATNGAVANGNTGLVNGGVVYSVLQNYALASSVKTYKAGTAITINGTNNDTINCTITTAHNGNAGTISKIVFDGADVVGSYGVFTISKPTYTASDVGLDKVGNYKAVSTASQTLTSTEQAQARSNIGAIGTSDLSNYVTTNTNQTNITGTKGFTNIISAPGVNSGAASGTTNVFFGDGSCKDMAASAVKMSGYSMGSSAAAITTSDTVSTAIGKLEKRAGNIESSTQPTIVFKQQASDSGFGATTLIGPFSNGGSGVATLDLSDYAKTSQIPTAVTESTVAGWGFTKNAGTVTGVKVNNGTTLNPNNGVVNIPANTIIAALGGDASDSTLASVAFSGSYDDLAGKPTIPTVGNAAITIKQGNDILGQFTLNSSIAQTINIPNTGISHGNDISSDIVNYNPTASIGDFYYDENLQLLCIKADTRHWVDIDGYTVRIS